MHARAVPHYRRVIEAQPGSEHAAIGLAILELFSYLGWVGFEYTLPVLVDASIIVAGGQESMSMAPHAAHLRQGQKMGDLKYIDTMIRDGLRRTGYDEVALTSLSTAGSWKCSASTPAKAGSKATCLPVDTDSSHATKPLSTSSIPCSTSTPSGSRSLKRRSPGADRSRR